MDDDARIAAHTVIIPANHDIDDHGGVGSDLAFSTVSGW
jgi:hypothetical protein